MPKFYLVNAHVPEETVRLLTEASEKREVEVIVIDAGTFDYEPCYQAHPGDLLYRAGVSAAAGYVEQHLYHLNYAQNSPRRDSRPLIDPVDLAAFS
ncbi:MAG TPA: hypothetical protein VF011_11575 [Terriglobales bacterium]